MLDMSSEMRDGPEVGKVRKTGKFIGCFVSPTLY